MLHLGRGTEQEETSVHQGEGEVVSHGEETRGSKVSGLMHSSVDVVASSLLLPSVIILSGRWL